MSNASLTTLDKLTTSLSAAFPTGLRVFLVSYLLLAAVYFSLERYYPTRKQKAWILTNCGALVLIVASIPFVQDLIAKRGSFKYLERVPWISDGALRAFQAYLVSDLTIGSIFYRERISMMTGWVHHSAYMLLTHYVIKRGWSHIFVVAGNLEVPTLLLGLGSMHPALRNDTVFAITFFLTRIVFHAICFLTYIPKGTREYAVDGSWLPSTFFALAFPMHVVWFTGCIKGFVKRANARRAAKLEVAKAAETPVSATVPADKEKGDVLPREAQPDFMDVVVHSALQSGATAVAPAAAPLSTADAEEGYFEPKDATAVPENPAFEQAASNREVTTSSHTVTTSSSTTANDGSDKVSSETDLPSPAPSDKTIRASEPSNLPGTYSDASNKAAPNGQPQMPHGTRIVSARPSLALTRNRSSFMSFNSEGEEALKRLVSTVVESRPVRKAWEGARRTYDAYAASRGRESTSGRGGGRSGLGRGFALPDDDDEDEDVSGTSTSGSASASESVGARSRSRAGSAAGSASEAAAADLRRRNWRAASPTPVPAY